MKLKVGISKKLWLKALKKKFYFHVINGSIGKKAMVKLRGIYSQMIISTMRNLKNFIISLEVNINDYFIFFKLINRLIFVKVELDYEVYVKTSNILNAGTDANVFIKIYGDLRKSKKSLLEKSQSHRNKFEKGNTDHFHLREEYFGEIEKVKIGHDNTGVAAGWHLEEVVIECAEINKKWIFACNRWLDADQDDGLLEVELVPIALNNNSSKYLI